MGVIHEGVFYAAGDVQHWADARANELKPGRKQDLRDSRIASYSDTHHSRTNDVAGGLIE